MICQEKVMLLVFRIWVSVIESRIHLPTEKERVLRWIEKKNKKPKWMGPYVDGLHVGPIWIQLDGEKE